MEKKYDHSLFHGRVAEFGLEDHNSPDNFFIIYELCKSVVKYIFDRKNG